CRVCVMGTGIMRDGDREHKVSFSSVNPNEQLVCVVGPGQLALDLGRSSILLRVGESFEIPVRIKRGTGWKGPVSISLVSPPHQLGIMAEPTLIATDEERAVLNVRVGAGPFGPITMPLTVRATL